jgi:uncharacterized small protein (DUF1192 family)
MADPSETTQVSSAPRTGESARDDSQAEVLGAIHELTARVGDLQAEVQTLRAQSRALPAGSSEAAGWDDSRSRPDLSTWVRTLDAPAPRAPAVPRLLLEILFLVGVAVAAAVAELDVTEIVAVMGVAWALVAVAEYAAARAERRRAQALYVPYPGVAAGYPTDPSWFAPPVERTVLDAAEEDAAPRAKLPPPTAD